MRLLHQNSRIIGTATDDYTGVTPSILAPADFDLARMAEYTITGETATLPAPPTLAQLKASTVRQIDAIADKIYSDVVGFKGEEYRSAEADAKAFAAAGFLGTAGPGVAGWATAKAWPDTQAANDILAQAAAWRGAQGAIRDNRLLRKEMVKAAIDAAGVNTAYAQWAGFANAIRGQLGV